MADSDSNSRREKIILAAIDLYLQHGMRFTMRSVAQRAKLKEAEVYRLFRTKGAVLKGFYSLCLERYGAIARETEGYDAFDFDEKLAHFVYVMFDLMEEQKDFVEDTFDALIFKSTQKTQFQRELEGMIAAHLEPPGAVSKTLQGLIGTPRVYAFLVKEYFFLVKFWLEDESDNAEKTMALADKLTAFIGECLKSRVLDRGLDLLKFLILNDVLKVNVPFLRRLIERA